MRFSVETWAPEYGASVNWPSIEETDDEVDVEVEKRISDWAPIDSPPPTIPEEIVFIDGIQRIDARIWIHHEGLSTPAVCASLAAGATICRPGQALIEDVKVCRVLIAPASSPASPIKTRHAVYEFAPAADATPEATYRAIHDRRHHMETRVAAAIRSDLIVFDGPLRGRNHHNAVGYVKTHHRFYLTDGLKPVLGDLGDGQRTPLFLIGGGPGGGRWSWYLRLPGPRAHPFAGIVRLELPGVGTADEAVARVGLVGSCLPRFASEPHRESRSPQNLYPIAGLERQLRQRLGDQVFLDRELRIMSAGGTM